MHTNCTLTGAVIASSFLAGTLLAAWTIPAAIRAGAAVGDWLADRIEIRRVL